MNDKKELSPQELAMAPLCNLPQVPPREFKGNLDPARVQLILKNDRKWVNGTTLHYYFFPKDSNGQTIKEAEKDVIRNAFETWEGIGMGISFHEVSDRSEAEIRIGFERGNGFWAYVGRDIIDRVPDKDMHNVNFGWDLSTFPNAEDVALHEIGHTLGLPHEHQNPRAGIVWNRETVLAHYTRIYGWDNEMIQRNILDKIEADAVQASDWDKDSIMHYAFDAGLINEPEQYRTHKLEPKKGLSERDKEWVRTFYPPIDEPNISELKAFDVVKLQLEPGEQKDLIIRPDATSNYGIQTVGTADVVMVLFEKIDGEWRYLDGEDDSGTEANAEIHARFFKGKEYMLRIRLFYSEQRSETAVMMWSYVSERSSKKSPQLSKDGSLASPELPAPTPNPTVAQDPFIYRAVVIALGLAVLLVIAGGLLVARETITTETGAIVQKDLPDSLIAIGSAAAGALAGLLAFRR